MFSWNNTIFNETLAKTTSGMTRMVERTDSNSNNSNDDKSWTQLFVNIDNREMLYIYLLVTVMISIVCCCATIGLCYRLIETEKKLMKAKIGADKMQLQFEHEIESKSQATSSNNNNSNNNSKQESLTPGPGPGTVTPCTLRDFQVIPLPLNTSFSIAQNETNQARKEKKENNNNNIDNNNVRMMTPMPNDNSINCINNDEFVFVYAQSRQANLHTNLKGNENAMDNTILVLLKQNSENGNGNSNDDCNDDSNENTIVKFEKPQIIDNKSNSITDMSDVTFNVINNIEKPLGLHFDSNVGTPTMSCVTNHVIDIIDIKYTSYCVTPTDTVPTNMAVVLDEIDTLKI